MTKRILALALAIMLVMPLNAAAADGVLRYNVELVTAVYSFDYTARTYQLVTDKPEQETIVNLLKGYKAPAVSDKNAVGFLVFTDKGKYPVYLPSKTDGQSAKTKKLVELSLECNKKYPRHIQWFAFMSPENIERITFSGAGGGDASWTLNPQKYTKFCTISLDTRDPASIRKISDYLKGLTVGPVFHSSRDDDIFYNPITTMDGQSITIYFKNGVTYGTFSNWQFRENGGGRVYGKDHFLIGASDLNEQLAYQLDTREIADFMMGVPGVKINTDFS